ncbi:MAG: SlyX family protein [Rhodoferax sp.]
MPSQSDAIDQRLTDLEIKLSFQEDALDQLSATIVRQQQTIDLLVREVRHLREQIPQDSGPRLLGAQDEVPPHY